MKKFLLVLSAILCVTVFSAHAGQVTKDYRFGNVTGIKASSVYNIKLSKGNSDIVKVTADDEYFKHIKIYMDGNTLVLGWENTYRSNNKKQTNGINVVLQVNSLEELDLSGAASFDGNGYTYPSREFECEMSGASSATNFSVNTGKTDLDISGASNITVGGNYGELEGEISGAAKATLNGNASDVELEVSGAGNVSITNCNARIVDLELSGASNVSVNGVTDILKATVSGASSLKAKELKAMDATCYASGASGASVRCTGTLQVKTTTASKITYYGNPQNIISHNRSLVKGGE